MISCSVYDLLMNAPVLLVSYSFCSVTGTVTLSLTIGALGMSLPVMAILFGDALG